MRLRRGLVDVMDEDGVALELNLVVVASCAFYVTATVRIGVMRQLYTLGRALQGSFGLDQLGLGVGDRLVGIGQRFRFRRRQLLGPVRNVLVSGAAQPGRELAAASMRAKEWR